MLQGMQLYKYAIYLILFKFKVIIHYLFEFL